MCPPTIKSTVLTLGGELGWRRGASWAQGLPMRREQPWMARAGLLLLDFSLLPHHTGELELESLRVCVSGGWWCPTSTCHPQPLCQGGGVAHPHPGPEWTGPTQSWPLNPRSVNIRPQRGMKGVNGRGKPPTSQSFYQPHMNIPGSLLEPKPGLDSGPARASLDNPELDNPELDILYWPLLHPNSSHPSNPQPM